MAVRRVKQFKNSCYYNVGPVGVRVGVWALLVSMIVMLVGGRGLGAEILQDPCYLGEKTTISYAMWGGADTVKNARVECERFIKENPDVRMEISVYPWGQYWAKLQVQAASGLAPDIISLYSGNMAVWIERGALMPIDRFIERDGIELDDYYDAAVDICRWDEQMYCMPTSVTIRTLVYSVDRLEERGIDKERWPKADKPMAWEEFKALAEELTLRRGDGSFGQYGMTAGHDWNYGMFGMYGGWMFDRQVNPTRATVVGNDALLRGMIEMFQTQYGRRSTLGMIPLSSGSVNNLDTLILSNRFAMGVTGPWALQALQEGKVRFGLSPLPRADEPSQVIYVGAHGIYSASKNPEGAWRFIKFKASQWAQEQMGRTVGTVPSLIAARDSLIHNDKGIPDCEAFLYDLADCRAQLCTPNNYVLDAREKWLARLERYFDKQYDERLSQLPRDEDGAIAAGVYEGFVQEMNELIERSVRTGAGELQGALDKAFARGKPVERGLGVKVVGPLILLVLLGAAVVMYVLKVGHAGGEQKTTAYRANHVIGYLCISPWLSGFLFFSLLPIIASIFLSFTQWNMIRPPHWIGVGNYFRLLSDEYFLTGLVKTFSYAGLVIPISLAGGLFTAGLLTCDIRGSSLFKSIFYVPSLFTGAAAAVLWVNMFNKEYGVINHLLSLVGIAPINWLDEAHAFTTVVLMNFFWVGGAMIVYYAGMKQIPKSLYEAADIDGAGPLRKFVSITIPMLSPVILFMVVMSTIGAFQVFTPALFFASDSSQIGGPGDSLRFYSVNIYNEAFNNLRMGNACAYAIVLFVMIFVITMVQLKVSKRFVYSEGG